MSLEMLLLVSLASVSGLRGPPRAERREVQQVVKEGQTARLRCPITGSPAPLVTWSHRGEGIGWSWTRYRQNRRNLKIKKAVKQDTGPYVCKGTNGFGNAEVQINLIVIDPKDFPGIEDKDLPSLAPPVLTSETREQEEAVIVNSGDNFKLSCTARGFPAPLYSWYKDGEVRRGSGSDLVVSKAHQGHAGLWACRAQNMVGNAGRTFRVKVRLEAGQEEQEEKDEVLVEEGEKAVLQCRVRGAKVPKVRWLRRLGEQPMSEEEQVIAVGRERYQLLETGLSTQKMRPNLWHSTLTIEKADFSHAGPYICFVDGRAGFHFSSTRLRVRPKQRQLIDAEMMEHGVPVVGLTLTLVLIIALLLTAAIFCLVHKRPKVPPSMCEEEQHFEQEQRLSNRKMEFEGECRLEKLLEIPVSQLQLNVTREEEEEEEMEGSLAYYSHQYSPKKSHEKFSRSIHSFS